MSDSPQVNCSACGSEDLTQGYLLIAGLPGSFVQFVEKPKHLTVSREAVQARKCNQCGNLQLSMKPL